MVCVTYLTNRGEGEWGVANNTTHQVSHYTIALKRHVLVVIRQHEGKLMCEGGRERGKERGGSEKGREREVVEVLAM